MSSSEGLRAARRGLAGTPAWLVGGAVRDELLGRPTSDLDLVVQGDPAAAARAVARAAGGAACFALSAEHGGWRVVARDRSWQVDLEQLRGASLDGDLLLRDFTINAIARPLDGGEPVDPTGGREDLHQRRLRMTGPAVFEQDPLRILRLVRVGLELGLEPEPETLRTAGTSVDGLERVSGERIFIELRRIIASSQPRRGIEMLRRLGALAVVLGELEQLDGVEQSHYHHADVLGHTLEVLDRTVALTAGSDPEGEPLLAGRRARLGPFLAEPVGDEMTREQALRWGALLHDIAKPQTRGLRPDGQPTFMGHDVEGAELARTILTRLRASERLRAHVAALARHHLRLGFLVHQPQPLARGIVFDYLAACDPVAVDVTLLSVADRLATRGRRAEEAIAAHLRLAGAMLDDALDWQEQGPPAQLLRGDQLARELGITPGPALGELLAHLARARYAGEIATPEQALALARREVQSISTI